MSIWVANFKGAFSDGVLAQCGFHFVDQPSTGSPGADPHDIYDVLTTGSPNFKGLFLSCCSSDYTLDSIDVVECINPTDRTTIPRAGSLELGEAGLIGASGGAVPEALTAIIAKKTNVPRRWARGYCSIPGRVPSSYLTAGGKWSSTYMTVLSAFAAKLDDDYEVGTVEITSIIPVVYSRVQHILGNSQPWAQIEAGVVRTAPSWRRSRTTAP